MTDLNGLMRSLMTIKEVEPIIVTQEQNKAIESLVVAYMALASAGLEKDVEDSLMSEFDRVWDGLVITQPPKESGDV